MTGQTNEDDELKKLNVPVSALSVLHWLCEGVDQGKVMRVFERTVFAGIDPHYKLWEKKSETERDLVAFDEKKVISALQISRKPDMHPLIQFKLVRVIRNEETAKKIPWLSSFNLSKEYPVSTIILPSSLGYKYWQQYGKNAFEKYLSKKEEKRENKWVVIKNIHKVEFGEGINRNEKYDVRIDRPYALAKIVQTTDTGRMYVEDMKMTEAICKSNSEPFLLSRDIPTKRHGNRNYIEQKDIMLENATEQDVIDLYEIFKEHEKSVKMENAELENLMEKILKSRPENLKFISDKAESKYEQFKSRDKSEDETNGPSFEM